MASSVEMGGGAYGSIGGGAEWAGGPAKMSRMGRVLGASAALILGVCCLAALTGPPAPALSEDASDEFLGGESGVVSMAIKALKAKVLRGRQEVFTSKLDEAALDKFPEDVQAAINS